MLAIKPFTTTVAIAILLAVVSIGAVAKSRVTYVDPTVNIENDPCDKPERPCRTIANALKNTVRGGRVILLHANSEDNDTSKRCKTSYDPVTVVESVTIAAAANLAAKPCFNAGADNGIVVKPANDKHRLVVRLAALRFIGQGGHVGVSFHSGSALHVEKCAFQGVNHGITFAASGTLTVTDSVFDAGTPIRLDVEGGPKKALIENCSIRGHGDAAIEVNEAGSATMRKSKIDGDYHHGLLVKGNGSLVIEDSKISGTFDRGMVKVSQMASLTFKNTEVVQSKCCSAFFSCEPQ